MSNEERKRRIRPLQNQVMIYKLSCNFIGKIIMLELCLVAATTLADERPDGDHDWAMLRRVMRMLEPINDFARTDYYLSCNQVAECWNLRR